jgi:hypothetical protein
MTPEPINVVGLFKGAEHYIVLFDEASADQARIALGHWAENPELSLDWYDAAIMAQTIRARRDFPTVVGLRW